MGRTVRWPLPSIPQMTVEEKFVRSTVRPGPRWTPRTGPLEISRVFPQGPWRNVAKTAKIRPESQPQPMFVAWRAESVSSSKGF